GHVHGDAAEFLEVAPAAEIEAAVAHIPHEARLVPRPDLAQLDAGAEIVREVADELAEVDPLFAHEVNDHALAAEEVVDLHDLHGEVELLHGLLRGLHLADAVIEVDALGVVDVVGGGLPEDVPQAVG